MKGKISIIATVAAVLLLSSHSASASWSPIGFGFIGVEGTQAPGPDGSVYGLHFGILKGALDEMYGICIAGYFTETDDVAGLEIAGLANETNWADDGVLQIASILNNVKMGGNGTQIAGLGNRADDFTGIQIAAVCNVMSGRGVGVQIGAINSAENLSGVQIGAINIVEKNFSGVQIGAMNVLESSDFPALPILRIAF